MKGFLVVALILSLGFAACNRQKTVRQNLKICRVNVGLSISSLEEVADNGQIDASQIRVLRSEGLHRQRELLYGLRETAENENLEVSEDTGSEANILMGGDVTVLITFNLRDGGIQRLETVFCHDGTNGDQVGLNMWGSRMWPTPKVKQLTKALGFDLQEEPISVADVLTAVRRWRASQPIQATHN